MYCSLGISFSDPGPLLSSLITALPACHTKKDKTMEPNEAAPIYKERITIMTDPLHFLIRYKTGPIFNNYIVCVRGGGVDRPLTSFFTPVLSALSCMIGSDVV